MGESRHARAALAACGVALAAALALPAATVSARVVPGSRDATLGPLISGTSGYVGGTYVWTDYAYDDRGPDTDGIPGGDSTYAPGTEPGNAADFIQLQVGRSAAGTTISVILETLVDPFLPLIGIGIDTDGNAATGAMSVPGGRWSPAGALGLEHLVLMSGARTQLLRWTGEAWAATTLLTTEIDQAANRLRTTIPPAALDPGTHAWRMVGVAGLTGTGRSWVDGSGPIYDLAFVRAEDPNTDIAYKVLDSGFQILGQVTEGAGTSTEWQDKHQAQVLNSTAGSAGAVGVVDFSKVAAGTSELPSGTTPGWHTFLYYSPLDYGQGIQRLPSGIRYAGPFQPYGVKVPVPLAAREPLVLFLHGANENHLQNRVAFESTFTGEYVQPGHLDPPAIVAFLLGRDPSWASPAAEQDMLDVYADVQRRFSIDLDRVVVSGISNGGAGTFRMASLRPDLFAGGFSLVGADGTGLSGNLVNIPIRMQNGLLDPLVSVGAWLPTILELDARSDVDYRSYQNVNRTHTHVPALGNCIFREFIAHGRVTNPARVHYSINPRNEVRDDPSGLRISHTGAYWVSGLDLRDRGSLGGIDVTSLGRADRATVATPIEAVHNNALAGGADYCGPNPAVVTGDTWNEHGVTIAPGPRQPTSNAMTMSISNLRSATVDLSRMALAADRPLTMEVTGDGPTALRLLGGWTGPVTVTVDGDATGTVTPIDGAVTVWVGGPHTFVLTS